MSQNIIVSKLASIANALDQHALYAEADTVTRVATRLAQVDIEDQPFLDTDVIDSDFKADQGFLRNDDEALMDDSAWNSEAFDSEWEGKSQRIETLLNQEMLTPDEEAELAELTKGLGDFLSQS